MSSNQIKYKSYSEARVGDNAKMICQFINENNFARDQLLSITMNESSTVSGSGQTHIMTVWYRTKSIEEGSVPMAKVEHIQFSMEADWETLVLKDLVSKAKGKKVVCVCQSAGGANSNNQVLFFSGNNGEGVADAGCFLEQQDYEMGKMEMADMKPFMNQHFAPHHLVSFSIFEDDHPNVHKGINCNIMHTAGGGDNPPKLSAMLDKAEQIQHADYGYEVFESSKCGHRDQDDRAGLWIKLNDQVQAAINQKGADNGFLVTSYNRTEHDELCVGVVSWDKNMSNYFVDRMRPAECCCTIF